MNDAVQREPGLPSEIRMQWHLDPKIFPDGLEQTWNGFRNRIQPESLTVTYFFFQPKPGANIELRYYVSVEGRILRLSDGQVSKRRSRIAYWPTHEEPGARMENAPQWVQDFVAQANLAFMSGVPAPIGGWR